MQSACPVTLSSAQAAACCLSPSHLVADVVEGAAKTHVKDDFGFEMISQNKFTTAQIDRNTWTVEMLDMLMEWIKTDPRGEQYRDLDWSKEYDAAMPNIIQYDPRELDADKPEDLKGFYNIDMDAFESVIRINTMGTVIPIKVFAHRMAKDGGGSIINFASMNSYCPLTRCFAYAMSKAAVVNLTQSFAQYFASANIWINAIAPGFIVNERSKTYLGSVEEGLTKRGQSVTDHTPSRKFGQAQDICGSVRYLLDERASAFVTGITVPVDGGFLTLSGI